jgi:hypothetical protein
MFDWFQKQGTFTLPVKSTVGRSVFTATLFEAWATKDTAAALRAALQCSDKRDRGDAVVSIIRALRRTDPARAAAVAAEHGAVIDGQSLYLFSLGDTPKGTWTFLSSIPPGKNRTAMIAACARNVIVYQPGEMTRIWKEAPEDVRRDLVAAGVTDYLAFRTAREPGAPESLPGLTDMQRAWAEQSGDPKAARQFVAGGAREWARQDPAAAIAWAQEHLKGFERVNGTAQLFSAGAEKNFDVTLAIWNSLPDGVLRARAAGNLAAGAPPAHKPEMGALLNSLSPADRQTAEAARKDAPLQVMRAGMKAVVGEGH